MKSNAIEKSQPRKTDRDWLPSIKKLIYKRNNYTNNQELLKQPLGVTPIYSILFQINC